ncbi:MAG TPA: SDR family NAD(P)-dependent oxidoreductase [Solirubrobacteraceae bacterium]|nr:SDR family NAD(P)-dependent oxidoreductase [Solirubrobacteraceae bacterium]
MANAVTGSNGGGTTARSALVTGANRGIGREIARRLAAAGMTVVVGARDPRLASQAAREIPGEVRPEQLDVTDPASVETCGRRLAEAGIEIDVLVNNAGLYTTTALLAVDEERLMETLQVNLVGAWRTCREFVPAMRERGWGRVVNVSTGYAHFAEAAPQAGAYGLAKAGLNVLTRMIAAEAGPAVKVNSMSPGWVATRMGGPGAPATVEEGADTAVWLATLPDDGPTDGFFYHRERIPW